jgi:hypothetical protein
VTKAVKSESDPRVVVPMPPKLIERIENFRYEDRHPSRADAVRVLLEVGLDCVAKDKPTKAGGKRGS